MYLTNVNIYGCLYEIKVSFHKGKCIPENLYGWLEFKRKNQEKHLSRKKRICTTTTLKVPSSQSRVKLQGF